MLNRRCALVLLIVTCLLLLQGCWVYSAYPLAETEADLVFDRNLLGTWSQEEGCTLIVSRLAEEKNYRISYEVARETKGGGCLLKSGQSAGFVGSVVDLNGVRFLDLYPADRESMHHMMHLHSFYKMTLNEHTLTLIPMNRDWLKEQIASGNLPLAARPQNGEEDDYLVVTSSTHDLRSFIENNASSQELFSAAQRIVLQRKLQP